MKTYLLSSANEPCVTLKDAEEFAIKFADWCDTKSTKVANDLWINPANMSENVPIAELLKQFKEETK